jgi:hypothetical protein
VRRKNTRPDGRHSVAGIRLTESTGSRVSHCSRQWSFTSFTILTPASLRLLFTGSFANGAKRWGNFVRRPACPAWPWWVCPILTPYFPVPVSETVCGLLFALSFTSMVAVRVPFAEGVNLTLIVQCALAARLAPQVLVWA